MTKLLNLDDLPTGLEKSVVLKGVTHQMVPMGVGEFVSQQRIAQKQQAEGKAAGDIVDQLEEALKLIRVLFPSIPEDQVAKLSPRQVGAVYQLVNATGDEAAAAAAGAGSAEGN